MAFGVTTVNVFDLLDDENEETDPQTLSKAVAAKVSLKELEKAQAAKSAEPAPRAAVPAPAGRNGGRGDRGRGGVRGRGEGRGRGGYDRPRREEGDLAYDSGSAPTANRGRGRGRGEGRGDRGNGFRGERPARRQYDRHDGTGRGHEYEKRGGAGKGNWGPEGEEAAELKEAVVGEELPDEEVKEAVAEAEIPGADKEEDHVVVEPEPEPEPEVQEMSLEEYEALLEEKRANLNKTRSEAAKVDLEQFKGMKVAEKKEIEEDVVIELSNKKVIGKNKLGSEKPRKEKEVVETGFRVGDEQSFGGRSGGRGGRGEGRGRGRGRFDDERPRYNGGSRDDEGGRRGGRFGDGGGRRGGRDEGGRGPRRFNSGGRGEHTPQIDDVNSFPSLG